MKFVLPENDSPRRKHHEEMVKRLISSPRSRCAANTFIYRSSTNEREHIVGILNQWDKESYSTKPSGQVINKEAVSDIKEWCSNSGGKDLVVVKKFLQHLTNTQEKNNETDMGPDTARSGAGSERNGTPSYSRGNSFKLSDRPGLHKRDTLTNGSFYPSPFEGRGNNSGMFQIVKTVPQPNFKRPATSQTVATNAKPAGIKRQSTQPAMKRHEYFEIPTNRSGVFGEVIQPVPQQQLNNNRPASNARPPSNRPSSNRPSNARPPSNRPSTRGNWSRPGAMAVGRKDSKIPIKENRPYTQGSQMSKRDSSEKLKYSANYHDAKVEGLDESQNYDNKSRHERSDAVTPRQPRQSSAMSAMSHNHQESYRIDVSQSPIEREYTFDNGGDSSHRPMGISRRCPGRYWQPSQIF